MKFSKRSIDTLLDLVEIKLSTMQVSDHEDARELAQLETCRRELLDIRSALRPKPRAEAAQSLAPEPARA